MSVRGQWRDCRDVLIFTAFLSIAYRSKQQYALNKARSKTLIRIILV